VIPRAQRQRIAAQAQYRCGYCQTQEVVSGIPLTVEHLLPKAAGGNDEDDNLWLSCRLWI
jgi:5-methylcytosine-specific restriction endonuclease McrA